MMILFWVIVVGSNSKLTSNEKVHHTVRAIVKLMRDNDFKILHDSYKDLCDQIKLVLRENESCSIKMKEIYRQGLVRNKAVEFVHAFIYHKKQESDKKQYSQLLEDLDNWREYLILKSHIRKTYKRLLQLNSAHPDIWHKFKIISKRIDNATPRKEDLEQINGFKRKLDKTYQRQVK